MAPKLSEHFVATVEAAAKQMELPAPGARASAEGDTLLSNEAVLRELLDDSHARLRELSRSLQGLKDFLTL